MDFSGSHGYDTGAAGEGFRLSVMLILFLIGAGVVWLLLRRSSAARSEGPGLARAKGLRRVCLLGGVGILCAGLMALVYYSDGPSEKVTAVSGKPGMIAFLPISRWGFGVSGMEVLDRMAEREAGCASAVEGMRLRLGFLEYRRFDWPPPCLG